MPARFSHRRTPLLLAAAGSLLAAGALAALAQPADKPKPAPGAAQPGTPAPKPAHPGAAMPADHTMLTPSQLVWKDGPDSLPPGAKIAMLEGDLASAGPFTMRARLPAKYHIAAHTHPAIEHVTVISGTFHMGVGDKLDTSKGQALPAGGFAVMQVGTHHFAWTDEECVVQVHGIGPWGINYIDPATDPRNKPKK